MVDSIMKKWGQCLFFFINYKYIYSIFFSIIFAFFLKEFMPEPQKYENYSISDLHGYNVMFWCNHLIGTSVWYSIWPSFKIFFGSTHDWTIRYRYAGDFIWLIKKRNSEILPNVLVDLTHTRRGECRKVFNGVNYLLVNNYMINNLILFIVSELRGEIE